MKTFYEYWNSLPTELRDEYGPGAIVASKMAWDACISEVLERLIEVIEINGE